MRAEAINPQHHLGIRPFCACCGGGEHREGYTVTKAKSRKLNERDAKSKPKGKRPERGGKRVVTW